MGMTYKDAGVDIDTGNSLISRIKKNVETTFTPSVLSSVGGFASLTTLGGTYNEPVLVSGTDGVGTKLLLAKEAGIHNTIGIDLVAMCVNDVITTGAKPLFFLDYLGCGTLAGIPYEDVVAGIVTGCKDAGCALVGGETAELPGMYPKDEYDLAGFSVGVVERESILDGRTITPGDVAVGIASTGFHSNGYSLVRKVVEFAKLSLTEQYGFDETLGTLLLKPTRIYAGVMEKMVKKNAVKAAAHITGGGLVENAIRVLPKNVDVVFERALMPVPALFTFIQEKGDISESEMRRTFNMGIGFVVFCAKESVGAVEAAAKAHGYDANVIGFVKEGKGEGAIV